MIYTEPFLDELQKIAAAKWRSMLRLGKLKPHDITRLQTASRPTGGKLFDYGREVSGIERGNEALLKKLDAKVTTVSPGQAIRDIKAAIGKYRKGDNDYSDLVHQGLGQLNRAGGAALTVPAHKRIYMKPGAGLIGKHLKDTARSGAEAVTKRHEIDELRAAYRKVKNINKFDVYIPTMKAQTLRQKLTSKTQGVAARLLNKAMERGKKHFPHKAEDLDLVQKIVRAKIPVPGRVVSGRHMSPFPVLNEGEHLPMVPPAVRKAFSKYRAGESETMGHLGYRHGQAVTPKERKNIMTSFESGTLPHSLSTKEF